MKDKLRGTGRTTRQMMDAPKYSVYVWVNSNLSVPKYIAERINRFDLEIVSPQWLFNGWEGRNLTGLTIDHAAWETFGDEKRLMVANAFMRVRP